MEYKSCRKQKKILVILFTFFSFFLINSKVLKAETIKNYNVTIQINKDATLTVNEVIDYEFDVMKHGIYRDIPLRSRKEGFDIYRSYVRMNSVKRNGEPEHYSSKSFDEGIRYRVGSANTYVNQGLNTYEFNYTIYNAVFEKDGIYQIYYNAIGQFWEVPIEKATVTVKFSPYGSQIEQKEIEKLEVYTGSYGEKSDNYNIDENSGEIKISTKNELSPDSGLTFMLNLKTDKINPTFLDKVKLIYYTNPIIILGPVILIILTIYAFVTWLLFGRDPARKAVIPEFNLPKDMSAMFAAYMDGARDPKEIMNVGVLSLLSKGYITAEDKDGDGKNVKYNKNTEKTNNEKKELYSEEIKLYNALSSSKNNIFKDGDALYSTGISILKNLGDKYNKIIYRHNYGFLVPFILAIPVLVIFSLGGGNSKIGMESGSYFLIFFYILGVFGSILHSIFREINKIFILVGVTIIVMLVSLSMGIPIFVMAICFLVLFFGYMKLIGKYTNEGIRKKEYLQGMKMYIKTAEENQIKKFNDVDEMVSYFKGILPFAVALGVKNEAIKLMRKAIKMNHFNESDFNRNQTLDLWVYNDYALRSSLSREYNTAQEKVYKEKFSSSRGGSSGGFGGGGFSSGGGFSGGGSGGGGGGSW